MSAMPVCYVTRGGNPPIRSRPPLPWPVNVGLRRRCTPRLLGRTCDNRWPCRAYLGLSKLTLY